MLMQLGEQEVYYDSLISLRRWTDHYGSRCTRHVVLQGPTLSHQIGTVYRSARNAF
jgi:hypothetical protein